MKAVVIYMPVIHNGYLSFLEKHLPAHVFLLSVKSVKAIHEIIGDQLSRDIRSIPILAVRNFLRQYYDQNQVEFLKSIEDLREYSEIVMPDEDISHVIKKLLPEKNITFDSAFLRWDWSNSNLPATVEGKFPVSTEEKDRFIMAMARRHAGNSSDVWRQVGAAVQFPDDVISMAAFNEHMPDKYSPYVNGDPRLHMNPGEKPEICTAIHAEVNLIAQAAKKGRAVDGLSIYVTTFPCAPCARAIVAAGFKKVFFQSGYSNLDAVEVLVSKGVEILQVQ